jgi:Heterokaryon incompatibility protein (HET)
LRTAAQDPLNLTEELSNIILAGISPDAQIEPSKLQMSAYRLLQRQRPLPPEFAQSYSTFPGLEFYITGIQPDQKVFEPRQFKNLKESDIVQVRIAIVLAAMTSVLETDMGWLHLGTDLNRLLEDISRLVYLHNSSILRTDASHFFLEWYLRATFTRLFVLLLWFILMRHCIFGFESRFDQLASLKGDRGLLLSMDHLKNKGDKTGNIESSPYMCNWALQLLMSNRASIGLDFSRLVEKYGYLYKHKPARCSSKGGDSCSGRHPLECGRFIDEALVQPDQSVYDCKCNGCIRIHWNESSYDGLLGKPRAVSILHTASLVEYIEATSQTLAISHVWSHGHGGRPSIGMNQCLHKKFSRMARDLGCDSYWIDTLCIPEDHTKRKDAILFINRIFAKSKATLILDKDLMSIEINAHGQSSVSLETSENVLTTLLLCDWNVRAWTILEAVKGAANLKILCSDDRTISLRDCLVTQCQEGQLDIAVLFLGAQHLLPLQRAESWERDNPHLPPDHPDSIQMRLKKRSVEEAASMLSHRHTSREGDEIVIWSLLMTDKVSFNVQDMWMGMIGEDVKTGFLMCHAPRLKIPCFSWAPATPYNRTSDPDNNSGHADSAVLVYDGEGSRLASITKDGLFGAWLICHLQIQHLQTLAYKQYGNRLQIPRDLLTNYLHVALISPVKMQSDEAWTGYNNARPEASKIIGICVSNNNW